MPKVYYHGLYHKFDYDSEKKWKESITYICNQGILSRRIRGVSEETEEGVIKFNGLDYISVCERLELSKEEHLNQQTAYHSYIYRGKGGVIVNGNIDVITPTLIDIYGTKIKMSLNPDEHYCWMLDDRHVKDQIPPEDFIGLFYPYEESLWRYQRSKNEKLIRKAKSDLEFLRRILKSNNLDIPIIDSSRDEYLRDLTPVLTYKRSNKELFDFYMKDNF